MKLRQRIIMLASIGFGLGILVGVMIPAIGSYASDPNGVLSVCSSALISRVGDPLAAMIINVLGSGIFGAISMGGSAVYSIEEWSVVKCTVTHYVMAMGSFAVFSILLGWFTLDDLPGFFMFFLIMTVIYTIIWLCFYISSRIELKKVNEELKKLQTAEERKEKA